MKFKKTVSSMIGLLLLIILGGNVQAAEYNAPQGDRTGTIQAIDIGNSEVKISGRRYKVSQTVSVEIAGSYGAFTMLKQDMNVAFTYQRLDNGVLEILSMRELMPGDFFEEA